MGSTYGRDNFEEKGGEEGRPIVKYRENSPCVAAMRPVVKLLLVVGLVVVVVVVVTAAAAAAIAVIVLV